MGCVTFAMELFRLSLEMIENEDTHSLIIFDGVCNFCNGAVSFILRNDVKEIFYFTPNQSDYAQKLFKKLSIEKTELDSVILIKNAHVYTKSDAALEIVKELKGIYSYLYLFKVLPKGFRDFFYLLFAKNRYKIFGKKDSCMVPSKDFLKRFIL